jgi:hypothetical protein
MAWYKIAEDDFNSYTTDDLLGADQADWNAQSGDYTCTGTQVRPSSAVSNRTIVNHDATLGDNQYAKADISLVSGSPHGLALRSSDAAQTCYVVRISPQEIYFGKYVAGAWTPIGADSVSRSGTHTLEIRAEGTTITILLDDSIVTTMSGGGGVYTDSSISGGKAGLCSYITGSTKLVDNFECGDDVPQGEMDGSAAGDATVSGTLSAKGKLDGVDIACASIPVGTMTGAGAIDGTAAGVATIAGSVSGTGSFAGTAAGQATTAGAVIGRASVAGTAAGDTVVLGPIKGKGELIGTAAGIATTSATIDNIFTLSGMAAGVAAGSGTMQAEGKLAGSAAGVASESADLIDKNQNALRGGTSAGATCSGLVIGIAPIDSNVDCLALTEGTLTGKLSMSGAGQGVAVVSATIGFSVTLRGTSQGQAATAGSMHGKAALFGVSTGTCYASVAIDDLQPEGLLYAEFSGDMPTMDTEQDLITFQLTE